MADVHSITPVSTLFTPVENVRDRALEAWKSCPRKKLVAGTAVTMCWNLFSIKTRFVAGTVGITYGVNISVTLTPI
jgi:hypothetical protein